MKSNQLAEQARQENMMRKIEPIYTRRVNALTRRYYKQSYSDHLNNSGVGFTALTAKYRRDMRNTIEFYSEKIIKVFGKDTILKVKSNRFGLELKSKSYIERVMQRYILQHGATQAALVTETSRDDITEVLANTKQSTKTLEQRIAGLLGTTLSRAATIARTETHNASQFAVNGIAKEIEVDTGVKMMKAWVASQDERTRPDHAAQDPDNWIGMDEMFQVGEDLMAYPADPNGSAEQVINCRCALVVEEADFV